MASKYVTAEEFALYVGSELVGDMSFLDGVLLAAESAIEKHCQRAFTVPVVDAVATARTYVPSGDLVVTHDFSTTVGLTVTDDGSTVAADAFQVEPIGGIDWGGNLRPYWQLRLLDACWSRDGDKATVSVTTAKWGWPAIPAEVKQAVLILGKDLAHVRDLRFGVAAFGDYGVVRARANPVVAELLAPFRHPKSIGIA